MSDLSGDALAASLIAGPAATGGGGGKIGKLMPTIAAVGILTVIAIAGGSGVGMLIGGGQTPAPATPATADAPAAPAAVRADDADPRGPSVLLKLAPVVTNVSSPPKVLLRVEATIVFHEKEVDNPEILAAPIQSGMPVFLGALELPQVEGARGLLHLREDLKERAQLRSPAIEDMLIQSLVVQ